MKVLVTGNAGYIGMIMTKDLMDHSHEVTGLDVNYFKGCKLFASECRPQRQINRDIRDVRSEDLKGIEAIIHLAALSNDPLGDLNPALTEEINYRASVRLAKLAKEAGIARFLYSSSCSLYGIADTDKPLNENSMFNPITAYAKSKVQSEEDISRIADKSFHPVFMRNATVYGLSPLLRLDLVVNNLTAAAFTTGKVSILSDGSPWRPNIHVEDFCQAFRLVLQAPVEKVSNQAFNVGVNEENYQIKDIARQVEAVVPECKTETLSKLGSDERSYSVDFSKFKETFPEFHPRWNVKKGIEQLYHAFRQYGLTEDDFKDAKYFRLRWIKHLLSNRQINDDLKWEKALTQ